MMEQLVPEWMCNEFFTQCMQKEDGKQNIVVTNITVSPAVPPGNNYGSLIFRTNVEYQDNPNDTSLHSVSLIVKAELTGGPVAELFSDIEPNEFVFYYNFLPKAKVLTDMSFIPKTLFSPRTGVLILEDLKVQGFIMVDRTKQVDFNHCRLYVTTAATLHAVSFAVFKEYPELTEPIKKLKVFSSEMKGHEVFLSMIKYGMKYFADATEKLDRFKRYGKVIRDVTPHLWNLLVEANKPTEAINTMVQGDPWITNMMFKYDEQGVVSEIKLLDFQNAQYASPIHDVMSFIWSSANTEVKKHKLDELYDIYRTTFNEKLEQFHCNERLTRDQFLYDVKRYSPLALFQAGCTFPFSTDPNPIDFGIFLPKENGDDTDVDNFYKKFYDENYSQNVLSNHLECLESAEVFEFLDSCK